MLWFIFIYLLQRMLIEWDRDETWHTNRKKTLLNWKIYGISATIIFWCDNASLVSRHSYTCSLVLDKFKLVRVVVDIVQSYSRNKHVTSYTFNLMWINMCYHEKTAKYNATSAQDKSFSLYKQDYWPCNLLTLMYDTFNYISNTWYYAFSM